MHRFGSLLVCCAVLLAVVAAHGPREHKCVHDELDHKPLHHAPQQYDGHHHDLTVGVEEQRRRLTAQNWSPIRVKVVVSDVDSDLPASVRDFWENKLLPATAEYVQQMLQVVPVSGNLFATRTCKTSWTSNGKCKEYYEPTCGSSHEVTIPSYMLAAQEVCPTTSFQCQQTAGGTGVPGADFVIFANAVEDAGGTCGGGTLAFASSCVKDQYDRPIFASANFCPDKLDTDPDEWWPQLSTAVHEVAHALGFSSNSFPYFRDELGNPRTPRDSDGKPPSVSYTCDGSTRTKRESSTDTIQYFAERGHTNCDKFDPATCVMKMVTPKVQAASRYHFDCATLQGAEIENQPTTACQMMGSHLEQRLFMNAVMASTMQSDQAALTTVTLALFEDSGWYRANYSMATPMQRNVDWGFGQGCEFAMDKCLAPKSAPVSIGTPAHFCSADMGSVCTANRLARGVCNIASYTSSLDSYYQYFTTPTSGGSLAQADYCPYFKAYSNRVCRQPGDAPGTNYMGEVYSTTSRCFDSTLSRAINGRRVSEPRTGCYEVNCVNSGRLTVTVETASGTQSKDCFDGTTSLSFDGYSGSLTCIDPAVYCSPAQELGEEGSVYITPSEVYVSPSTTTTTLELALTQFPRVDSVVSVRVQTMDGTAKAGTDYVAVNTTVTWAVAHGSSKTVAVEVMPFGEAPAKSFTVNIVEFDGVTAGSAITSTVTLRTPPANSASSSAVGLVMLVAMACAMLLL